MDLTNKKTHAQMNDDLVNNAAQMIITTNRESEHFVQYRCHGIKFVDKASDLDYHRFGFFSSIN